MALPSAIATVVRTGSAATSDRLLLTSTDTLAQSLIAAGGDGKQLLGDVATAYATFTDRYLEQNLTGNRLLTRIAKLTGDEQITVTVPAGTIYQAFQTTLKDKTVTTARLQLIDFAQTYGVTLVWKQGSDNLDGTLSPDPTRAARGERLFELVSMSKGGVTVPFEAQYSETITFAGTTSATIRDLTSIAIKTSAPLTATFKAGTVTLKVINGNAGVADSEPLTALREGTKNAYLFVRGMEAATWNLAAATVGQKLQVASTNFTGLLEVKGSAQADTIAIEKAGGEVVVHAGGGNDTITVGVAGSVSGLLGSLQLFGEGGDDSIVIDDSAATVAKQIEIDRKLLEHSVSFEQTSRITDVLSLQGLTGDDNSKIADSLKAAAIPDGQKALDVSDTELKSYRDAAATSLLTSLSTSLENLQTTLTTETTNAITLLNDTDKQQLINQIKLYVRARYYEDGPNGENAAGTAVPQQYLLQEILKLLEENEGIVTYLSYEDYDPSEAGGIKGPGWNLFGLGDIYKQFSLKKNKNVI